eukprot:scaffold28.g7593.t1
MTSTGSDSEAETPLLGTAPGRAGGAGAEARRLASLGWPLVVEEVLAYGSTLLALGVAGRLGGFSLSVFLLAHSVTNISGQSVFNGLTSGIETLCSQTHGSTSAGAGVQGVILQRSLAIMACASLPLVLLYARIEQVLLLLGQEPAVAHAAARYIALYSPAVVLHAASLCVYRYLTSQGAVVHVMSAGAVLFAVTLPVNWLLVFRLGGGLGLDGSALAAAACELAYLGALAAAAVRHNRSFAPDARPWQGLSRAALAGWGHYLSVSLPSLAMVALDWWVYDVSTLLAGALPDPELPLAATGLLYNLNSMLFMVPFGLAFAVCFRVGTQLGAGQPVAARLTAEVGTALGLGSMVLLLAAAAAAGRDRLAGLFTPDADVVRLCGALWVQFTAVVLTNGSTAVLSAVLRGAGRQKHGALTNGVVNWGVGLPLQLVLAFRLGWGVQGLWWGLALSSVLQTLVLAAQASRMRWQAEAARAARLAARLSSFQEEAEPAGAGGDGSGRPDDRSANVVRPSAHDIAAVL